MFKKSLGAHGETLAKKYLKNLGYKFITQNFRTKYGEIDLIFQDGDQIVFVEVKTRSDNSKGLPEEAITPRKISHLEKAINIFFQQHPKYKCFARIDAVSIIDDQVKHIININQ